MRKVWAQVFASLLLGAIMQEAFNAAVGRNFKMIGVFGAIIIFTIITIYFSITDRVRNRNTAKNKEIQDEDLLDQ